MSFKTYLSGSLLMVLTAGLADFACTVGDDPVSSAAGAGGASTTGGGTHTTSSSTTTAGTTSTTGTGGYGGSGDSTSSTGGTDGSGGTTAGAGGSTGSGGSGGTGGVKTDGGGIAGSGGSAIGGSSGSGGPGGRRMQQIQRVHVGRSVFGLLRHEVGELGHVAQHRVVLPQLHHLQAPRLVLEVEHRQNDCRDGLRHVRRLRLQRLLHREQGNCGRAH